MSMLASSLRGRLVLPLWTVFLFGACGDGTLQPDPNIAPLVGRWDAHRMIVENKANPTIAPDLIQIGATFFLDVQPSGQYTAILRFQGQPITEFGRIEVRSDQLLLHRELPTPARTDASTFRISADTLFLEGDTEFDFNLDGEPEPALLRMDLLKRP